MSNNFTDKSAKIEITLLKKCPKNQKVFSQTVKSTIASWNSTKKNKEISENTVEKCTDLPQICQTTAEIKKLPSKIIEINENFQKFSLKIKIIAKLSEIWS